MTGRIHAIAGTTVTIHQGATCFGCMRPECNPQARLFTAHNSRRLPLKIGQMVEIEAAQVMLIGQALAALLPPALGFLGGFMLTGLLAPGAGDPARAAGGALGLFALAYLTYHIRKGCPTETTFHVARVLAPEPVRLPLSGDTSIL
ncbi:MAG: SoxR reducing system RseC family protein [Treponema sp.]|nr:SoxR reducing system RseC family protein [Treponema sp.]